MEKTSNYAKKINGTKAIYFFIQQLSLRLQEPKRQAMLLHHFARRDEA